MADIRYNKKDILWKINEDEDSCERNKGKYIGREEVEVYINCGNVESRKVREKYGPTTPTEAALASLCTL